MTFKEVQLQEVLDIQWGDTKTTKAAYVPHGYVAYSASGPDGFLDRFDYDSEGVVLSAIGANCGSTFFASGKWSCIKNTIRMFPKSDSVDLKYFFYMTKSPHFWPIRGSAQPFISQTDIRELYVRLPDMAVQKRIGQILHEIELKIANNIYIAKTLEEIVQTIFKSWFIDFDPVKAKVAGESPVGMDSETAELFPDSLVESESGRIPEGWSVSALSEFAQISKNSIDPQKFPKTDYSHYSIPAFDRGNGPDRTVGLNILSNKFVLDNPSVLLSKLNPQTERIWTLTTNVRNSICSTEFIVLEPILSGNLSFLNATIRSAKFQELFKSLASGSTGSRQRVRPNEVLGIACVHPTTKLVDKFEWVVFPMLRKVEILENENRALRQIRDCMLPRMISGELEIPREMLAS